MQFLLEAVQTALTEKSPIHVVGNNSKEFLHTANTAKQVSTREHSGVIDYQPSELFIRVKAGTALGEIKQTLADKNQFLAFEPPDYANSTIGGTVACALSGPTRPNLGALRDHILGVKLINGKAQHLNFGGNMIKNVAGFDVTRLVCGSRGSLGIITEVSLKVLPRPVSDITMRLNIDEDRAIKLMQDLGLSNHPLIASAYINKSCYLRFAGFMSAVQNARTEIKGEEVDAAIWLRLNPFAAKLETDQYLWRTTVKPDMQSLPGTIAIDWGGMRRWIVSKSKQQPPVENGKSILWQGVKCAVFPEKPEAIKNLEQKIKTAFDPERIFI